MLIKKNEIGDTIYASDSIYDFLKECNINLKKRDLTIYDITESETYNSTKKCYETEYNYRMISTSCLKIRIIDLNISEELYKIKRVLLTEKVYERPRFI
jgi:hypothetical protein